MSDSTSYKGPTLPERSRYWRDVWREAWELSREQFQIHHGIIVAALALLVRLYFLGREEMVNELLTSLLYVAAPVMLYLVGLYVVNFIRAMIRVSVYRQREVDRLTREMEHMKAPRLQLAFPEAEFDRTYPHHILVFVKVTNPTALTVPNVSVRIISIVKIDEPEHSDFGRRLKALIGLPLMIHGEGGRPPDHHPRHEVEIHAGNTTMFDVVTLQRGATLPLTETAVWHAMWYKYKNSPMWDIWAAHPSANLDPGHYRLQLKAQGQDTPPEMLTIEFMNIPGKMWVRQVEESPSLS